MHTWMASSINIVCYIYPGVWATSQAPAAITVVEGVVLSTVPSTGSSVLFSRQDCFNIPLKRPIILMITSIVHTTIPILLILNMTMKRNIVRAMLCQEIKVITDKIRDDEVSGAVEADWKFAAMVLDRLCLFFFSAFTVVATISVLAVAPHIIVY